ncbi:MAG: znuC [Rickettsiaceae bacterium]|jgi:zinc transport system ATP-binding protein|nr:znuC [Rickettsiaceae bacterium]
MINCQNISVSFSGHNVLKDVSLSLKEKEIVTIIGPNGSGKTTLLRIICGLHKPDSGTVTKEKGLVIGYMPQKLTIDKVLPLTVRRFLRLNGKRSLRDINSVEKVAEEFGILHLMKKQVHDISGGEMQRVMLARAILLEPNILILDEPTQGLDINGQSEFYQLISDIRDKRNCAILMVSHDLHMVMAATDRVICINKHICCEGSPEHINSHPEYLALFGRAAETVALYTHKHDHVHGIDGHIHGEGCNHD